MQHPYPFTSFNIRPCWPLSPSQAPPETPPVKPLGLLGVEPCASPIDTLRVCLWHLELFCTGDDASLWDLRWPKDHKNVHPVSCQDRPRLIKALAEALLTYENLYTAVIPRAENLSPVMQELAKRLSLAQKVFVSLYTKRKLRGICIEVFRKKKSVRLKVTPPRVDEALKVLAAMTASLPPGVYRQGIKYVMDDAYDDLVVAMEKAFKHYGPQGFRSVAVRYAIASIIKALGIEEGEERLIAERLRKPLKRAQKSSRNR